MLNNTNRSQKHHVKLKIIIKYKTINIQCLSMYILNLYFYTQFRVFITQTQCPIIFLKKII